MSEFPCDIESLSDLRTRIETLLGQSKGSPDAGKLSDLWRTYQVAHCETLQVSALMTIMTQLTQRSADELAPLIDRTRDFLISVSGEDHPILLEHGCISLSTHSPYDVWATTKTILAVNTAYSGTEFRIPKPILQALKRHFEELNLRLQESRVAEEQFAVLTKTERALEADLFRLLGVLVPGMSQ